MVTIQFSNETGRLVAFSLSPESLRMISRFLHYISFADHDLYIDSSELQTAVADFYDSIYDPALLRDAKFLKCMIDFFSDIVC